MRRVAAVVVLGCVIRRGAGPAEGAALVGAAGRRAAAGARAYFSALERGWEVVVVPSGGCSWPGVGGGVEADALAEELIRLGVDPAAIRRERRSTSTQENARYTARLLEALGVKDVLLATCGWHLPRAEALFRRQGLVVEAVPAVDAPASRLQRAWRWGRERVAALLPAAVVVSLAGCPKPNATPADAGAAVANDGAATLLAPEAAAVMRAEDQRRAKDISELARTSHDPASRRRVARALARIGDDASAELLARMLADEDEQTAAWAAYGLGRTCKGREEVHVRALVARATGLVDLDGGAADAGARGAPEVDLRTSIARAIGRCAAPASEPVLAGWVRAQGPWSERAAFALADVAARRGALTEETMTSLLEAAEGKHGAVLDVAITPLGRLEHVSEAFVPRAIDAAKGLLAKPGVARIFAVRALGRTGKDAAPELVKVVTDRAFTLAEREEAARGLGLLGDAGQAGIAEALGRLVPDKDPFAIAALGSGEYGVLSSLVGALAEEAQKKAEPALVALSHIVAPGAVPEALARRLAELRCGASLGLARAAFDADVLKKCDTEGSEAWERARLAALVRRPLNGERRAAWKVLARSKNIRVREDAVEAFSLHGELGDVGRAALAEALASKSAGLVATAAAVVQAHPDRVMTLAESEKRAALDPRAPPPTTNPARDVDPAIARALKDALAFGWAEDLVETRVNLLDAAAAVRAPGAREAALLACKDVNVTMRERAAKALRALGDQAPVCAPPDVAPPAAKELDHLLTQPTTIVFQTDAGELSVTVEPDLSPVTATRLVELARAGFFKGIVVHRVVPGFVVQFGDPGGDGYGGGGTLLRDETSPVAFGPLDVGVALAGHDTGSSQIFITLARYPHLDGEYARIGRAAGDWSAVAQGDVIREARVRD